MYVVVVCYFYDVIVCLFLSPSSEEGLAVVVEDSAQAFSEHSLIVYSLCGLLCDVISRRQLFQHHDNYSICRIIILPA